MGTLLYYRIFRRSYVWGKEYEKEGLLREGNEGGKGKGRG